MMRILAPNKFKSRDDFIDKDLNLKEFSTLMEVDPVGDKVVKIILDEVISRRAN